MSWGGWDNFWAMGGYAVYVWGSYGVTLALIVAEIVALRARARKARATARRAAAGRPS